jgi:hypothetical protein
VCGAKQDAGLLCSSCCDRLERDLGDVASIVAELRITITKQDRMGAAGKGAPARERNPVNWGVAEVADDLGNVLTTWARDVLGGRTTGSLITHPAVAGSYVLLSHVPEIRKHPAVEELVDEVTEAITRARRAVDRPADKQYLGQCMVPTPDEEGREVTCLEDVYASPTARFAVCKVCGVTHDVAERRASLLKQAEDRLFTVRDAAQIIGSYGDLRISESTIRNYISNGQIVYHGKVDGVSVILMGDLMQVVRTQAAKPKGKKLLRAS